MLISRQVFAIALTLGLGATLGASAAGSGTSESRLGGSFFSPSPEGFVTAPNPALLQGLRSTCRQRGEMWAFKHAQPFRCAGLTAVEGGYVWEIRFDAPAGASNHDVQLFSLRPFPAPAWRLRKLARDEIVRIQPELLAQDTAARSALLAGEGWAVVPFNHPATVFFIPGQRIEDEPGGYYAREHVVLTRIATRYARVGEIDDRPRGYVDLDADGQPEVLTNPDCDGTCWSAWKLGQRLQVLAEYGAH
jgi:hypothetical protein